jgi:signal transduction histidine kinase
MRLAQRGWYIAAAGAIGLYLIALPLSLYLAPNFNEGRFATNHAPLAVALNIATVLISLATASLSLFLAAMLFRQRSDEGMALFTSYCLLLHGIFSSGPLEILDLYITRSPAYFQLLNGGVVEPIIMLLFLIFPDGRFVPRGSRWLAAGLLLLPAWTIFLQPLVTQSGGDLTNPVNLGSFALGMTLWVTLGGGIFYAQVYRYRYVSNSVQRLQMKWLIYGLGVWLTIQVLYGVPWLYSLTLPPSSAYPTWLAGANIFWSLSLAAFPITLAIATLRYRLYNIDLIINRTLVYGALTAIIIAIYVLGVGGMGILFQSSGSLLISLPATGLVAALFQPLRARLQQSVNRLMYGERDSPYQVLRRLGQRLETGSSPDSGLSALVETIGQALKLPHVEISIMHGTALEVAAVHGKASDEPINFPLIYRSETIGYLQVSPRSANEAFSAGDEQLLRQIARQTGPAAHAVQLNRALQSSRIRLVTAREEERRRLRRDLHDGLGPVLASQGLKMAAASQFLHDDPEKARQLLEDLLSQNESTVAEIRRLVYDLRPPAIDELGLAGAIRELSVDSLTLQVEVQEPDRGLPRLPAAVEVAAYRIATEAFANVSRHAHARRCTISLSILENQDKTQILCLRVEDDGIGLPKEGVAGIGLNSMKERAEEVGGELRLESQPGQGTEVIAWLPLAA